ncbi:MAG: hypothetical protein JXR76_02485 [Deltaproteobacteria bacterium]|nr:hypothetical protein [Deltaproteobacteria bacterium]
MWNTSNQWVTLIVIGIICGFSSGTLALQTKTEKEPYKEHSDIADTHDEKFETENFALRADVLQLQERLQKLEQKNENAELEAIIEAAQNEAEAQPSQEAPEDRNFLWGALALQKLNPEISVSADILATMFVDKNHHFYNDIGERSGFSLREVSLHVQHTLDPFSSFKGAIAFIPGTHPEVEVEEMYITWFGLIPSVSVSVGRFRQNLGILNRWHGHDLDQTSYPLALSLVLGDEGLAQTGVMIKWFMPAMWAHANELVLEITNAENDTLLAGEFFSVPSILGHLKNYWDVTDNTYIELGLSGLWGMNNKRGYFRETSNKLKNDAWRQTFVGSVDLTLQWTPLQKAKYRSFTWRSEAYVVHREMSRDPNLLQTGESDTDGKRYSFGAYSYVDFRASEQIYMGIRGDIALPTVRSKTSFAYDIVPYITFWQSEFVYMRIEYAHQSNVPASSANGVLVNCTDNKVMLQIDFAAGPHKHEKY